MIIITMFLFFYNRILLTTTKLYSILKLGDKMKRIEEDKRIMELEYNLICDFIKLRNELGLSQQKMADTSGVVREMIAVIENRKKHH